MYEKKKDWHLYIVLCIILLGIIAIIPPLSQIFDPVFIVIIILWFVKILIFVNDDKYMYIKTFWQYKKLLKIAEKDDLLLKFAERKNAAEIIAYHFNELPKNVQDLLFKLAEKDRGTVEMVAIVVKDNFDKLPENVRNELLLKLAEKDDVAGQVAYIIICNFNKLPDNVRDLLFKLAEKDSTAGPVASAIADKNLIGVNNFDKLPKNIRYDLLLKLAEKDVAVEPVANTVAYNYNKLPKNVQCLLFKLAEKNCADSKRCNDHTCWVCDKKCAAWCVGWAVAENLNTLPEVVRHKLLLNQKVKQGHDGYIESHRSKD